MKLPDEKKESTTALRKRLADRHAVLKNDRSSWKAHWDDLTSFFRPRRSRWQTNSKAQGNQRNDKIINSSPLHAVKVLAAGMMAGITSPARKWFQLTVDVPELNKDAEVRGWLDAVEQILTDSLAKSNLYNCLHEVYVALSVIGTAVLLIEEDTENAFHGYVMPVGQYCLANSSRFRINTVFRELPLTIGQMVEKFGLEKCSAQVQQQFKEKKVDDVRTVLHVIEPNPDHMPGKAGSKFMPYRSVWLEKDCEDPLQGVLWQGGFVECPFVAPRWEATGEDVYGASPSMDALGDAKSLQTYELHKALAIEKMVDPPMGAPASLQGQRISLLPGDVTYLPGPVDAMRPLVMVPPSAVAAITEAIREHEHRVDQAMSADLWLMISDVERGNMTATEVTERQQEKMLQLGPVMERLEQELLNGFITRCLGILFRKGILPKPPDSIQGRNLVPRYTSIMAQAQRLVKRQQIEALASFAGNLAARPELAHVLDKVNADAMLEEYADAVSAPASLIRSDDEVAKIRATQAQQQAQAQQMQQAQALAQGAKTLSQTDMSGDNGLTQLLGGGMGGINMGTPGGVQ